MCRAKWRVLSAFCPKLASRLLAFGSAIIFFASGSKTLAASYADGIYQFRLGHYSEASQIFQDCMAGQPNNSELYYYSALTYERLHDFQRAVEGYNYVKQHFPKSQAARFAEAALQRAGFRKILYAMGLTTDPRNPRLDTFPKETWVSFTRHNNALIIDGAINEHPCKMVFDTGASSCVFSVDQLEELGIQPPQGPPTSSTFGIGSNRKLPVWTTKANLRLGKIERKEFPIVVTPVQLAYPLLGENFFHDLQYTIDNDAKAVVFKRGGGPSAVDQKLSSAMTVSAHSNYVYNVPFTVENRALVVVAKLDGVQCPMIFDTGADICTFTSDDLKKLGIKPQPTGQIVNIRGSSGTAPAQYCVIERAELGPINGKMACLVTDEGIVPKPLLGQSFFKDWQYTIDRTNRVIQFAKK